MKSTKKILLLLSVLFLQSLPAFSQETTGSETPASLYEKINSEKKQLEKAKNIVIDKEITSSEFPFGMSVKSRTYFAKDKAREEASISNHLGAQINIIAIFTKENTYVSYDGGTSFSQLDEALIGNALAIIEQRDFFLPEKSKLSKNFYDLNGSKCYAIGENTGDFQKLVFIEKGSYHILRAVVPNGKNTRIVTDMSDYKKIGNFSAPFKIRISVDNLETKIAEVTEVKITNFQTDVKFDDSLFIPENVSQTPQASPIFDIKSLLLKIIS